MKIIIIYLTFICIFCPVHSQTNIDSSAVVFKAKLLTTSIYGLADSVSILQNIQNQQAVFLASPSQNLMLIRIHFNQKHFLGTSKISLDIFGDCHYYLAFIVETNQFYRLGGFEALDLEDFFKKVDYYNIPIYSEKYFENSVIDFLCLEEYNDLSDKKKRKRGFDCIESCKKALFFEHRLK